MSLHIPLCAILKVLLLLTLYQIRMSTFEHLSFTPEISKIHTLVLHLLLKFIIYWCFLVDRRIAWASNQLWIFFGRVTSPFCFWNVTDELLLVLVRLRVSHIVVLRMHSIIGCGVCIEIHWSVSWWNKWVVLHTIQWVTLFWKLYIVLMSSTFGEIQSIILSFFALISFGTPLEFYSLHFCVLATFDSPHWLALFELNLSSFDVYDTFLINMLWTRSVTIPQILVFFKCVHSAFVKQLALLRLRLLVIFVVNIFFKLNMFLLLTQVYLILLAFRHVFFLLISPFDELSQICSHLL